MHKLSLKSLCLVSIILIATGRLASANLITNPGFETGDFTGWTTTPAASGSLFDVVPFGAHTGSHYVTFQAVGSGLDAISQTFASTAGVLYDLSFWLGNIDPQGSPNNEFRVTFGGVIVQDLINAVDFGYTLYTFSVLGTGSPMTLEFGGRNRGGGFSLDDVSVEARVSNGTGVSDAGSSVLLLGVALVGLLFFQRRFAASVI